MKTNLNTPTEIKMRFLLLNGSDMQADLSPLQQITLEVDALMEGDRAGLGVVQKEQGSLSILDFMTVSGILEVEFFVIRRVVQWLDTCFDWVGL
uniref:Uncharacterized protein n=1 Tax=Cannabis sativa TaxID=3483 RepID=A0A803P9S2_CANSA